MSLSVSARRGSSQAALVSRDSPEQLIIALEPEAASIYCRKLRLHQMLDLGSTTTVNGSCPKENIESGMTPGTDLDLLSFCFSFVGDLEIPA